jgi:tetratricopeptide (TPR) repeat protein
VLPEFSEVQNEAERILASREFASSPALSSFLQYCVNAARSDRNSGSNEYAIGTAVFGRGEDFDPRIDPIVRVQARKLRGRLDSYYANSGKDDAILIRVPKGGYVAKAEYRKAEQIRRVPPLVGRGRELETLTAVCAAARNGKGSLVFICGEPGIGKSALAEAFMRSQPDLFLATGQCTEALAGVEAFLPILELLNRLITPYPKARELLKFHAPAWFVQLIPHASSMPDVGAVMSAAKSPSPQRLKREFLAFLRQLSTVTTVVALVDDLQWSDPSSLDLLAFVGANCADMRLLLLAAFRPPEFAQRHPGFRPSQLELMVKGAITIELPLLTEADVDEYLNTVLSGDGLAEELAGPIHQRTEGNALFVIDTIKDLLNRGVLGFEGDNWRLTRPIAEALTSSPGSIGLLIERNLSRLPANNRQLLESASVLGLEFHSAILARSLNTDVEATDDVLKTIDEQYGIIRWLRDDDGPQGDINRRYRFMHALYRDAFDSSLSPARRKRLTMAAGEALLSVYGDHSETVAALAASLFTRAQDFERASAQHLIAGLQAAKLSAHREAVTSASRCLECLSNLPASTARKERELKCLLALGKERQAVDGIGSLEAHNCYSRAFEIASKLELRNESLTANRGLLAYYLVRARFEDTRRESEHLLVAAQQTNDLSLMIEAYQGLSFVLFNRGEFSTAAALQQRAIELYDQGNIGSGEFVFALDPGVGCRMEQALNLWITGSPDKALRRAEEGLALARELGRVYSIVFALMHLSVIHELRREPASVLRYAEDAAKLAHEHELTEVLGWAAIVKAKAIVETGRMAEGIEMQRRLLAAQLERGSNVSRPHFLASYTESLLDSGDASAALAAAEDGLRTASETGASYYTAELLRLKAKALAALGRAGDAGVCLKSGIEVARHQHALSWELRCTITLGTLRRDPRPVESLLSRFTEGFESGDLIQARQFIQQTRLR